VARYAKTDVRIWDDERVKAMTPIPPCGQGLWIRLLISRHRSAVPGLLCVGEAALAEEFNWSLEDFRKAFGEAKRQGLVKADWKARVVWLPKAWKYNSPESPNVVKSWRIPWDETPECALKLEIYQCLKAFIEGFKEGFKKAFREACSKPSPNQEQEPEPEQEHEESLSARDPSTGAPGTCHCGSGQGKCLTPSLCEAGLAVADAQKHLEAEPDIVAEVKAAAESALVDHKTAYDWLCFFKIQHRDKMGREYGQGKADAVALGNLGDLLTSLPSDQRAEDWSSRERMVAEFLNRTDHKTRTAGWPFCFFTTDFRALAIPPHKRPLPAPGRNSDPSRGHYAATNAQPLRTGRIDLP
jgi:hypothetical protein